MTAQGVMEPRQVEGPSRRPGVLATVLATLAVAAVVVVALQLINDEGPVPAKEARIELTFSDEGTSFVGDREIVEGTVTVTFENETATAPMLVVWGYETGSAALADELAFLEEGERGVPSGPLPTLGFFDVDFDPGDLGPGIHSWTMDLSPGTYLVDVGPPDFRTTGLWRMAVIEVVSE